MVLKQGFVLSHFIEVQFSQRSQQVDLPLGSLVCAPSKKTTGGPSVRPWHHSVSVLCWENEWGKDPSNPPCHGTNLDMKCCNTFSQTNRQYIWGSIFVLKITQWHTIEISRNEETVYIYIRIYIYMHGFMDGFDFFHLFSMTKKGLLCIQPLRPLWNFFGGKLLEKHILELYNRGIIRFKDPFSFRSKPVIQPLAQKTPCSPRRCTFSFFKLVSKALMAAS